MGGAPLVENRSLQFIRPPPFSCHPSEKIGGRSDSTLRYTTSCLKWLKQFYKVLCRIKRHYAPGNERLVRRRQAYHELAAQCYHMDDHMKNGISPKTMLVGTINCESNLPGLSIIHFCLLGQCMIALLDDLDALCE